MQHALIIHAHQHYAGISTGKLNEAMADVMRQALEQRGYLVQETVIAAGYDTEAEVDKHEWADLIILQSPVFWFGTPWIYKKYVDDVFTAALMQQRLLSNDGRSRDEPARQYGTGGKMQGTRYMLSLTWNAPREAFGDARQMLFEGKSVDDVFLANTANYKFCGAAILPAFSAHDVMKQADIGADIARLQAHLAAVLDS
jgi:modulator of drug activity B